MKKNCWEVKNCGRQEGGLREKDFGVCPAYSEAKLDRIHDGKNAGRACWVVAGTMCGGKVQGTYAEKLTNCIKCDFYTLVRNEEQTGFKSSGLLLGMLRGR